MHNSDTGGRASRQGLQGSLGDRWPDEWRLGQGARRTEASVGGPLARLRDGDWGRLNARRRHSIGTCIVSEGIAEFVEKKPGRIKEVLLAAADINGVMFEEQIAPSLGRCS